MKIQTGDTVVIITGKDKGKTGQILRILKNKERLVVADINIRTRHMKASAQRPGQIVKYEASIHQSNVMLVDAKTKKRTRVGFSVDEKGKRKRIAKRSGEAISKVAVKAQKDVKASTKKEEMKKKTEELKGTREGKESSKPETSKKHFDSAQHKLEAGKKQPFWKKMGFGAEAIEDAAEQEGTPRSKEDHSVPDQNQRSSGRGSTRGS